MMMRSVKRWVAIGLTAAVAAVGLEVATPVVAGATQVDLVCKASPVTTLRRWAIRRPQSASCRPSAPAVVPV